MFDLQMVLRLSACHVKDLMLLRKLYLNKKSILCSHRAALLTRFQSNWPNPLDHVAHIADAGLQLQSTATEEHKLYCMMSRALYCGVRTLTSFANAF